MGENPFLSLCLGELKRFCWNYQCKKNQKKCPNKQTPTTIKQIKNQNQRLQPTNHASEHMLNSQSLTKVTQNWKQHLLIQNTVCLNNPQWSLVAVGVPWQAEDHHPHFFQQSLLDLLVEMNSHHQQSHWQWLFIPSGRKAGLCSHTGFPSNEPVYDIPYVRAELPLSPGPSATLQSRLCPTGSPCWAAEGAVKGTSALLSQACRQGSALLLPGALSTPSLLGAGRRRPGPSASASPGILQMDTSEDLKCCHLHFSCNEA